MTERLAFAGRVVAIFGDSSAVGAACGAYLTAAGATVVQGGDRAPSEVIADAVDRFGCLDVALVFSSRRDLMASAGEAHADGARAGRFLAGEIETALAACAEFERVGRGRLVLATSSVGVFGHPKQPLVAAVDGAMIGLAKSLALAARSPDIRVNAVAAITEVEPESLALLREAGADPANYGVEYVVPMIAYLAHDDCRVSGSVFTAGGGRYARLMATTSVGTVDPHADVARIAAALDSITEATYPVELRCATDELLLIDV